MASVGTVSVDVMANISGFEGEFGAALYLLGADHLLHQFLEHLDRQGMLQDGLRPSRELVHRFIKSEVSRVVEAGADATNTR